ncbi:MAG: class I SAM-dependent methyltransferase, partial [Alphaproteobacteria bacterium]
MLTVQFDKVSIKDGHRVLDLGCGEGRHTHEAFSRGEVHAVGVDLGFEDLKKTQEGFWHAYGKPPAHHQRWSAVNGNALSLPFEDGTFDV